MYLHTLKVGDIVLENNILLAPMAGITDLPFRKICKEFHPGLVYTEMASAKAIYYGDQKTKNILDTSGEKRPIAFQLFGNDKESLKVATNYVNDFCDMIDLNMGCPAPKVVKNGDGSKLLLDLDKIEEVVKTVVENAKHPVTVKIRKGWDKDHIVAVEAAKRIEKAGACLITIHGRTRDQYYSGQVDLDIIKKVKSSVHIPVIGNGDIRSGKDALKMFEYTGVDGIMIGRASLGNPWIFREVIHYLQTKKELEKPTLKEKFEIMKTHIDLEIQQKGEFIAIKEMRKHIAAYTKHMKDSTKIREKINKIDTKEELMDCLIEYFKTL